MTVLSVTGRSILQNTSMSIEIMEEGVKKLFEEVNPGQSYGEVYLDAAKCPNGDVYFEQKVVRTDGAELLQIKTRIRNSGKRNMTNTVIETAPSSDDVSDITFPKETASKKKKSKKAVTPPTKIKHEEMKDEKNDEDSSSEEEKTSMNLLPVQPSTTATKNVG